MLRAVAGALVAAGAKAAALAMREAKTANFIVAIESQAQEYEGKGDANWKRLKQCRGWISDSLQCGHDVTRARASAWRKVEWPRSCGNQL
jgi:hypothetical protein